MLLVVGLLRQAAANGRSGKRRAEINEGTSRRYGSPKLCRQANNDLAYTLSRLAGVARWHFGKDCGVSVPVSGHLHANNGDALVTTALAGQSLIYPPGEVRQGNHLMTAGLPAAYAAHPKGRPRSACSEPGA